MIKVREDLTGQIFGMLTVVKQAEDYVSLNGKRRESQWLCECNCENHNQIIVTRSNLKNHNTKSCGCLKTNNTGKVRVHQNLIGQKFGRLVVLEQVEDYIKPNGIHLAQWLCECSCEGHNKIVVLGESLKSGNSQSCGCLNQEFISQLNQKENKRDLSGEYGIIWSTNTNEEIYFDLEDADKILKHTWFIESSGYPATHIGDKMIRMHVFLGYGWHDHHDLNKLNNCKNNLFPCTVQENNRNSSMGVNNTSGFIGVTWSKRDSKWVAQITINYKNIYLGTFYNKVDAIKARLQAEQQYFGEFAPQRHLFKEYGIKDGDEVCNTN